MQPSVNDSASRKLYVVLCYMIVYCMQRYCISIAILLCIQSRIYLHASC